VEDANGVSKESWWC